MSQQLPPGWVNTEIAQIASINPRHPKEFGNGIIATFVPMAGLSETKPQFGFTDQRPLGKIRSGFTHFAEGDVLFAKITPCMENGKGAVARGLRNGIGCGTTELHVIRPKGHISPEYIYRFLSQSHVRRAARENFSGTAGQARVPTNFIKELKIPIPPIAEQLRIVAKLETLLTKVDTSQMRLGKIPAILKRFRQSVLAAACSGRLTADWRLEQTAERIRTKVPVEEGLPDIPVSWHWVKLPKAGEMNRGKSRHRPRNEPTLFGGPYPFIQTGDIAQSNGRIMSHKQTYSENGLAQSRLWPTGTICITIAANIAESAILTYPACFPDSVVGIIADPKIAEAQYIEYFMRVAKSDLSTFAPATAQKNINIAILNEVAVPLPPVGEQREIVRQVEALFALANQIESRYRKAKARVNNLTQSILAKAFRGELVRTEAQLAEAEGRDYESAEELLRRIEAERARNTEKSNGIGKGLQHGTKFWPTGSRKPRS